MSRTRLTNINDLKRATRPTEDVSLGEDSFVTISGLFGDEIETWRKGNNATGRRKPPGTPTQRIIQMCILGDDGRPQFSVQDIGQLMKDLLAEDSIALERAVMRLNGLLDEDEDEDIDEDETKEPLPGNVDASPSERPFSIDSPSLSAGEL